MHLQFGVGWPQMTSFTCLAVGGSLGAITVNNPTTQSFPKATKLGDYPGSCAVDTTQSPIPTPYSSQAERGSTRRQRGFPSDM